MGPKTIQTKQIISHTMRQQEGYTLYIDRQMKQELGKELIELLLGCEGPMVVEVRRIEQEVSEKSGTFKHITLRA